MEWDDPFQRIFLEVKKKSLVNKMLNCVHVVYVVCAARMERMNIIQRTTHQ